MFAYCIYLNLVLLQVKVVELEEYFLMMLIHQIKKKSSSLLRCDTLSFINSSNDIVLS